MSKFVEFLTMISKRVLSDFQKPINRELMLNIKRNHVSFLQHNSQCIHNQKFNDKGLSKGLSYFVKYLLKC